MTVIENINIAYVSQDLSLLSSADADGTKDLLNAIGSYMESIILFYSLIGKKAIFDFVEHGLSDVRVTPSLQNLTYMRRCSHF